MTFCSGPGILDDGRRAEEPMKTTITVSSPLFPPSFFYYGHERDITSTETRLLDAFQRIALRYVFTSSLAATGSPRGLHFALRSEQHGAPAASFLLLLLKTSLKEERRNKQRKSSGGFATTCLESGDLQNTEGGVGYSSEEDRGAAVGACACLSAH
ncbi:hypothetical protein EYF80_005983 [Liparis tanakae]|uniref:Uncharacterized protein n=1 Tax=Liparis tanakae TaxID=230148 RepID=A0A4Z2J1A1_9TELE|nr:hypothetical protein EYF80_005983 [Liparis tanakae]